MKNILIVGSGAREQAITLALVRSNSAVTLFCLGTNKNPGIMPHTEHYAVCKLDDIAFIVAYAKEHKINLCIIGPENALAAGLSDALKASDINVIGPTRDLARIETDKAYARDLMTRYRIPGLPKYRVFTDAVEIPAFLNELGEGRYVVKATGLMGGKGVKVAGEHLASINDAIDYAKSLIADNHRVVIEEKLIGQEFSAMCFTDGKAVIAMPLVQDHKRAYEGDSGPNTGGMGSYSDATHTLPFLNQSDVDAAYAINCSIIDALFKETGQRYHGILYGSFIATATGISVIEFNARFGDPEAMNVLSLLETDFVSVCHAIISETLDHLPIHFKQAATVCKYAVPKGYPDQPQKNIVLDDALLDLNIGYFYGAVDMQEEHAVATGSRTLAFVGVADTIGAAEQLAERHMQKIKGAFFYRKDIGTKEALHSRINMMNEVRST